VAAGGFVSCLNLRGEVVGLTLAGGESRWRYKLPGPPATALGLAADVVCLATGPRSLVGLDPTQGTVVWQGDVTERIVALEATGDQLWVGGADGALLCLEGKTGEPVWQAQLEPTTELALWVDGEKVWAGTARRLWCFPR